MDLLIRVVATQDPAAAQFIPGIRLLPTEKVAGETLLDGNETTEPSPHFSPDGRALACYLNPQRIFLSRKYSPYSAPSENPL
jgi:hypothetical protein